MSNLRLNELNSATKNGTKVTLNISLNLIGNSNDETNFLHKLLLTKTSFCKAFANVSSANIKFLKTHLSKMIQPGGIPVDLLSTVLKAMFVTAKEALKREVKRRNLLYSYYIFNLYFMNVSLICSNK